MNRPWTKRWTALSVSVALVGCQGSVPTQPYEQESKIEEVQASVEKVVDPKLKQAFEVTQPKLKHLPKIQTRTRRNANQPEPFEVGDRATFDVYYLGVKAGSVVFSVLPFKEVKRQKAYHFRAEIESSRVLRFVYRIKTKSESLMDFEGLFSHRFEVSFEDKRQAKHVVEMHDHVARKSYSWSKRVSRELGDQEKKETMAIKPWIQDGLSGLIYPVFLPLTPGTTHEFPAVTEGKPWTAKIRVMDLEPYRHPVLGSIEALRIVPARTYDNPSDAPPQAGKVELLAWVLPSPRVLVAMEARTKFGLIKIVLKTYERQGKAILGASD